MDERGACERCGSGEVLHVVFGFLPGPLTGPEWVVSGGCVVDGAMTNRHCETCGHDWLAEPPSDEPVRMRPRRRPERIPPRRRRPVPVPRGGRGVRLLSPDGAAFALVKVPVADSSADHMLVDIELLTPDRLVRYLARPVTRQFLEAYAGFLLAAAADPIPEQSVATVEDPGAGLSVVVIESTEFGVTLEVGVLAELDADVPDRDGIAFDVPRASLIRTTHELERWLE